MSLAASKTVPAPLHRIPSLDGLRAVSIALVLIGHMAETLPPHPRFVNRLLFLFGDSQLGVRTFFVISGFLITTLLLKEFARTGKIGLKEFYIRRVFRIFPAFYAYLLVVLIMILSGHLALDWPEYLSGVFFLRDYSFLFIKHNTPQSWYVGHLWTLSVEEQFYLIWPCCLILLKPRNACYFAIVLIVLAPLLRLWEYAHHPAAADQILFMLHTRMDSLMVGCLMALVASSMRFQAMMERLYRWQGPWVAVFFLFYLSPTIGKRFGYDYAFSIGWTLENFSIALVMMWVISHPETIVGRVLNSRAFVHVGVLSYSLYLWQQLFLTTENTTFSGLFPLNLLAAFLTAELSYYLIESPALSLRKTLFATKKGPPAFAAGQKRETR